MFSFNKKKIYCLMHKDIVVLKGEYSLQEHGFHNIEILNAKHLPTGVLRGGKLSVKLLNHWWRWRGIPEYRVGLPQLMTRLSIKDPKELIEKEYALSLSDTYWLKTEDDTVSWNEINFFHRDFDQSGFAQAMFSSVNKEAEDSASHTPNSITCGYHKKAWIRRGDSHYLLKGGSPFYQQEPINEWLASRIASQLGLYAIPYETEIYENNLVSVCERFTDEDTDLVTCEYVLSSLNTQAYEMQYESYIHILEKHGIADAKKCLSDQMVLDYLLMNCDRHTQNMGILVDANTNEWKAVAPVFDTGTGLGCLSRDNEILSLEHENNCQLFNARHISHETLLNYILFDRYDFSELEKLPREYGNQLVQYQNLTGISNERIENAYTLFYKRILSLKKIARRKQV